ncbi:ABC-2 type transporter [Blastochloris viridis]|nr:ABC-2 type transporter [Blastochloris viridis]
MEQGRLALADLNEAVRLSWFWLALGWVDILQRYRGSMLGPFWLTLTTAAFIAGLGPLYAQLFNLEMAQYLPYLAIGFTAWGFINGTIADCCNAFIFAGDTLKQIRVPRLALLFQVIWRNVIVFAHSLPIFVVVLLFLGPSMSPVILLVIPGFVLVVLNLVWIGLVVAILCTRFRDIGPIITSVMQIAFFLTPVMWDHRNQRVDEIYIAINPFASYIELIRAPLLEEAPDAIFVVVALGTLVVGSALAALLFIRARRRIVYWV